MKYCRLLLCLFLIVVFLVSCSNCKKQEKEIVFLLEETEVNLNVGDKYVPQLLIENIENYELEYKYESSSIIVKNDVIHCLAEDICVVTIYIKNQNDVKPVSLTIKINKVIPTKVFCDKEIRLYVNDTYQLNPKTEPFNATDTLVYSSNNKEIADVSETGIVTAISEGKTYIYIRFKEHKSIYTRVQIIVEKYAVESITSEHSISLTYNESYQLTWNVLPIDAEQEVRFEIEDESIASINSDGVITAHKYGDTTIKVISIKDSSKYAEVIVYVDGDKTTEILLENETINLQLGEEYELNYSILPATSYQKLNIFIEEEDGIGIDDNILVAKKTGKFTITLTTIDGSNITKTVIINVTGGEDPIFITNSLFDNQSQLTWNEDFDPLDNIKAYDNKDGDITDQIVVTGEVDNQRYGTYTLEYFIEDSDGNIQILDRTINVNWGYDVTVIGHAGSYYGVPNSEEAILYAAEVLKYPAIEIDLKQTKDGVFVLSHDPNWGDAILEETNYNDLKDVLYTVTKNAGIVEGNLTEEQRTYNAKICTFERFLEICEQYNIIAVIELKTSTGVSNWTESNAPHLSKMPKIMEIIKKYNMLDKVIFLSNQELCLNWVKTNGYEYIPCQYLTLSSCENEKTYNIVKKYNLDISFNVRDGIKISDEWLEKYRALGCKLAVFTFEEWASYKDIQTWIDRGVDYVTTDWHSLEKLKLPKTNND